MRRSAILALTLIAAAALATAAQAAHNRRPLCGAGTPRPILANRRAEIYPGVEQLFEPGTHTPSVKFPVYYGCVRGSSRRFTVGGPPEPCDAGACVGTRHITLARTTVAWEEWKTRQPYNPWPNEKTEWQVIVRNLRTGRVLHEVPTGTRTIPDSAFVGAGPTTDIVVKPDGAVAWILDAEETQQRYQVHALDGTGERVLATGPNIGRASLKLSGSKLSWTQGRKHYSTTLN